MAYRIDETIAAVASAPGGAMRGVIRMSGPDVVACLDRCFRAGQGPPLSQWRRAAVTSGLLSVEPPVGDLACDLYLWPSDRSYTRQPAAEIHTFGCPPLLEAALRAVCAAGARLAEPGEFTMRAFLAGRIDLTQAEAVLGVIDAESQRELDVALSQLAGGAARPLHALRDQLLDLLAHVEAGLDFVEEDIEFITPAELDQALSDAAKAAAAIAEQMSGRALGAVEARVVLTGWPNVGKSSLLNALVGDCAAIVSPTPGTTRDYVTRQTVCDGVSCMLVDTAGVDPDASPGGLSDAAQAVTSEQSRLAHLRLLCIDATRPLNAWERAQLQRHDGERLVVLTKIDAVRTSAVSGEDVPRPAYATNQPLPPHPSSLPLPEACGGRGDSAAESFARNQQTACGTRDLCDAAIETSAWTGEGLPALRSAIARQIVASSRREGNVVADTAVRCRESLRLALESLGRARRLAAERSGDELVAVELRSALEELGKTVGAVYTDEVLDRIFGRFCIGK